MSRIGPALALALMAGAANAQQSDSHAFCRMTVGSDKTAFDDCVADQIDAALAVARRLNAVRSRPLDGERMIEAYDECRGLWSPDWAEIERCFEARLEGD